MTLTYKLQRKNLSQKLLMIFKLGRSGTAVGLSLIEPRSLPFGLVQTSVAGAYAAYSITHDLGFCGLLNMVTFDGDIGIVFVEAYNYLSDLDILV